MKTAADRSLLILSFALLVVMLGYGIVMPLIPFLIERFGAGGRELGLLISVYSLMQLIFAPLWGALSDRVGRKPIIAMGVMGYAVSMFLFGIADSLRMLFLSRTLSGILSSAVMPTAMAYVGDHTEKEHRGRGMGRLGAAVGAGIIAGPMLSGLLSEWSLRLPFFAGSGLALLSSLMILLLLPDHPFPSHEKKVAKKITWKEAVELFRSPAGILLLLIFLISLGLANFQGVIGLFVMKKFSSSPAEVGLLWVITGSVMILGQGILTGPLTTRFGELPVIRTAAVACAVGLALIPAAPRFILTLGVVGFFILSLAMISPALNACISGFAGEHLGSVMGLNSAVASLGRIIGPLVAGYLFDLRPDYPFYSGAVVMCIGALVAVFFIKNPET